MWRSSQATVPPPVRNPLPRIGAGDSSAGVPGVGTAVGQVGGLRPICFPDGKAISNGSAGTIGIASTLTARYPSCG